MNIFYLVLSVLQSILYYFLAGAVLFTVLYYLAKYVYAKRHRFADSIWIVRNVVLVILAFGYLVDILFNLLYIVPVRLYLEIRAFGVRLANGLPSRNRTLAWYDLRWLTVSANAQDMYNTYLAAPNAFEKPQKKKDYALFVLSLVLLINELIPKHIKEK